MPEHTPRADSPAVVRSRSVRVFVWGALVILIAVLGAAALLAPVWVVPVIERVAQHFIVPRLTIEGPLTWQWRPQPSVTLNQLVLRDTEDKPPLSIQRLRLVFDPDALFAGTTPLDLIEIDAPALHIRQNVDGTWNFASWFKAGSEAQNNTDLPFRRLVITNGRIELSATAFDAVIDQIMIALEPADEHGQIDINLRIGQATLPHPRDPATALVLSLAGHAWIKPIDGAAAGQLQGEFDQSRLDIAWAWSPPPTSRFSASMAIDQLILDDYLPAGDASAPTSTDFVLPRWQDWPVSAELRVGLLNFRGLSSRDAVISLNADERP